MRRKVVTRRLQAVAEMRSAIRSYGAGTAARLGRRPAAPSGAEAAYRLVFEHLHAELTALESELESAELACTDDRLGLEERKSEQRQAKAHLECRLHRIQGFLTGFFQRQHLAPFRVAGATRKDSFALGRRATATIDFLRQLDLDVTPPILEVTFDSEAMAAELEAGVEALTAADTGLEGAHQAVAASRRRTDKACAEARRLGSPIASLLQCLGHLADDECLAGPPPSP